MEYVAYYRVSTKKQGDSGLGLEAQKTLVRNFIECNPKQCLKGEFTDIETGKNDARPGLEKAIQKAKQIGAKLVIAKLDRLSRNAGFIFTLKNSGVDFVCADMPEANTLTIGIFATLAQYERELISERTKKALQAKKATGWKPGNPQNLTDQARIKGNESMKRKAQNNENNKRASRLITSLRKQGLSFREIARELNESGYKTSRGMEFKATSVKRLYDRTL